MEPKRYKCPNCDGMTAVPILGGYPTEEAWAAVEAGDVILGGCCRAIGDPDRACASCHYHWDSESGTGEIVLPEEEDEEEEDD